MQEATDEQQTVFNPKWPAQEQMSHFEELCVQTTLCQV